MSRGKWKSIAKRVSQNEIRDKQMRCTLEIYYALRVFRACSHHRCIQIIPFKCKIRQNKQRKSGEEFIVIIE